MHLHNGRKQNKNEFVKHEELSKTEYSDFVFVGLKFSIYILRSDQTQTNCSQTVNTSDSHMVLPIVNHLLQS